jgi:Ran GTPase-activating protein (RanGAP) involved in mRNA processing and transport
LDIGRNKIESNSLMILCEALKKTCSLKYLNLNDNSISNQGLKFLSEALKLNESIEELEIGKMESETKE